MSQRQLLQAARDYIKRQYTHTPTHTRTSSFRSATGCASKRLFRQPNIKPSKWRLLHAIGHSRDCLPDEICQLLYGSLSILLLHVEAMLEPRLPASSRFFFQASDASPAQPLGISRQIAIVGLFLYNACHAVLGCAVPRGRRCEHFQRQRLQLSQLLATVTQGGQELASELFVAHLAHKF